MDSFDLNFSEYQTRAINLDLWKFSPVFKVNYFFLNTANVPTKVNNEGGREKNRQTYDADSDRNNVVDVNAMYVSGNIEDK